MVFGLINHSTNEKEKVYLVNLFNEQVNSIFKNHHFYCFEELAFFLSQWTNQLGYNTICVAQLQRISLLFAVKAKTVFFDVVSMKNYFLH